MSQRIYQVDAFSDKVFSGNPAAVCPLENWLSDDILQKIAMENNLAETAFYVNTGAQYEIRWFTPRVEVDLCGHATLATAHVLFEHEGFEGSQVEFHSPRSGALKVTKSGDFLTLNFPTDIYNEVELSQGLMDCFDLKPQKAFKGKTDHMLVYNSEDEIRNISPNFNAIARMGGRGVIITAPGNHSDFVSRFFAPQAGIIEDPVTGSAHTTLTPYWSRQLGKNEMTAIQLSERKGFLKCSYLNERVEISGQARLYLIGNIFLK